MLGVGIMSTKTYLDILETISGPACDFLFLNCLQTPGDAFASTDNISHKM